MIGFYSILHDLIDLSEGDFDRKNIVLKFFVFRKHFDLHWSSVSLPAIHSWLG